ncbi:MAG: siderophore-interacting protein [Pseudomonadota bacterium]
MTIISGLRKAVSKAAGRPAPRLLTVEKAWFLTPNMIRVDFTGPELDGFPEGREGGNCKLMIPEPGESRAAFADRLANGPPPVRRTYTVRRYDAAAQRLSIDFVAHGDNGPASAWAGRAKPGDFLGFAGPSTPKVTHFEADWYLVAADPSALPVAAATLEAMPRDAKGIAVFEITAAEDRQDIDAPDGVEIHWLVHPDPHQPSTAQEEFIRSLDWPEGRVQTCIAGESGVIKPLRAMMHQEKALPRQDVYVSGYWKIGLVEDEHQKMKRAEG